MAKLVVLYNKPADVMAFDRYYFDKHVPLAKRIPGVLRYEVNAGPVASPAGRSPYHLVAMLDFASMSAVRKAIASPEGVAATGDLANFATGGIEMLYFDTKEL